MSAEGAHSDAESHTTDQGDLKCLRCGIVRSHADANIEDINETCEIDREPYVDPEGSTWGVTVSAQHDWVEV